jgi:hypothetical protein
MLLTLLVVAALGLGGYAGWQRWHDNDPAAVASDTPPCPSPTTAPPKVAPAKAKPAAHRAPHVRARVVNGSKKARLAKRAAKTLHHRFGVFVVKVGKAKRVNRGVSVVRYPRRLARPARALAAFVVPHAHLKRVKHAKKVQLDIGTRFRSVAPKPMPRAPRPSPSASLCPT